MCNLIHRVLAVFTFSIAGLSIDLLAQGSYGSAMDQLAQGIHNSLSGTENKTVLVNFFRRTEGKGCNLDETITGDFEVAFGKLPRTFKVLNRAVLHEYAKEHKLQMEGQIDEEQRVKEAGKLLKADIIIFGNYRFVGGNLVLRVHADDIQTSEQLSILSVTCTQDRLLKKMCEEASTAPYIRGASSGAPGTRSETSGGTSAEPSKTTPAVPCGSQTGDYCFTNNGTRMVIVGSNKLARGSQLQIDPGQTECFYNLPVGVYDYTAAAKYDASSATNPHPRKGNFKIEACRTQTMTLAIGK